MWQVIVIWYLFFIHMKYNETSAKTMLPLNIILEKFTPTNLFSQNILEANLCLTV
jgi:hypothetical protein